VRSQPGTVGHLALSRPEARNAVSQALLAELSSGLREVSSDESCRVVVLAGEGEHFCAGADFAEIESGPAEFERAFADVLSEITRLPVPVLVGIQGAALGAGCQIALACDLAVATTDARIGIPSSRLGIVIGFENIERLVLSVGPKRAGELLYTGRPVSGETAAHWGLVNQAVPPDRLTERVQEIAEAIASSAPLSVRGSKRGIAAVLGHLSVDRASERDGVAEVDAAAAEAFASEDLREGIAAFRERRDPRFRGL
ncbi:MAG: enoyl-CoA hydratase/isomerase family protein, partial [Actinomycetota bacterium]|nr:enoyl-CoA hydratase/isomerase family protein [Actinomycetota bacterium]